MSLAIMTDASAYLAAIDGELRAAVRNDDPALQPFYAMLHYHLGWADEQFSPTRVDTGKRLRPTFCLLVCEMLCGDYQPAVPAAAAVELLHNFSLVHDDIEDGDSTRRHRPTLWTLVGEANAINAGDALFALAQRQLLRVRERGVGAERVLRASELFQQTCVQLVEGQYLDMHGEQMPDTSLAYYKQMIAGKTAALVGGATGIGAAVATDDARAIKRLTEFGIELGMAYQMTDDILGIWGDPAVTGKPAGADLCRKKKSLPVVLAWQCGGRLRDALGKLFELSEVLDADVRTVVRLMDDAGVRAAAEQEAEKHRHRASRNLKRIVSIGVVSQNAAQLLEELTEQLSGRTK